MKKPYSPTGLLFAGKSHAFSPRDGINYKARSLKAPKATFSP
jgi:hypothetical protein